MPKLSDRDISLICRLRTDGVLQDFETHRLDQRAGVILVACADGDQMHDVFGHLETTQADHRSDPRIHTLTCHGGALAYAPDSPVNKITIAHEVFLGQIPDARELKGINVVALYVHAPCGAATLAKLGIIEIIELQMLAKSIIKSQNHGIEIACFLHVDYPDDRKRTYFICRKDWEAWLEINRHELMVGSVNA